MRKKREAASFQTRVSALCFSEPSTVNRHRGRLHRYLINGFECRIAYVLIEAVETIECIRKRADLPHSEALRNKH